MHHRWECRPVQPLWKTARRLLKKSRRAAPGPGAPFQHLPQHRETLIHADMRTLRPHSTVHGGHDVETAECPWTEDWTKAEWGMDTVGRSSAVRKEK